MGLDRRLMSAPAPALPSSVLLLSPLTTLLHSNSSQNLPPRNPPGLASPETQVNTWSWDFPGVPVVKNLPSYGGDESLIPAWGTKIPHATGQLSRCITKKT